jgi:diguanylate cyclase (GGDEF) domain
MFYVDVSEQLNFLITVCFSFCIFFLSLWFKKSGSFSRIFGLAFIVPLLLVAASFITKKKAISDTLSDFIVPALLFILLILLALKPEKKYFNLTAFFLGVFPLLLIIAVSKINYLQYLSSKPVVFISAIVVLLIADMYFLKKGSSTRDYIFWALLPLSLANIIDFYINEGTLLFLIPIMSIVSFILFLVYLYNEYYRNMVIKTEEAEKKILRVNRTLDLEVKKRMMEIERINQNLVNISKYDSLSKVYNKKAILDSIDNLINSKSRSIFSILMFDIDNFKRINDTLGHVTGDKCIKAIATTVKGNLREFDLIGRYGGDEFIIVLPGTNLQQAHMIAERFRKKVEQSENPHYTISIGISTYPKDGTSVKSLIEVADEGLYKSKAMGRNTISFRELY